MRGQVFVWLGVELARELDGYARSLGVSRSALVRGCVLERLRSVEGLDDRLRRLVVERELEALNRESRRLRRVQNSILSDFVYLRDYADELVKGAFKNPTFVMLRKSVLTYPNGEKALESLEHLFSRRLAIGQRQCEIIRALYPENRYDEIERLKGEYREEHTRRLRSQSCMTQDELAGGEKECR